MYKLFKGLHFVYLEVNPIVVVGNSVTPLDLAAKIDETAAFLCGSQWGTLDLPAPFGRKPFPAEARIADADAKTGASLKLTILNENGRVWTMVAGGGASVVFADTIADLGYGHELANYGEYSGAPSEAQTCMYAKTILELMTKTIDPKGKILILGGGIANFTDVAATFIGIISAFRAYEKQLKDGNIKIYIRRAGPNYQEGLRKMRDLAVELSLPIKVFGPETDAVAIVPMALGKVPEDAYPEFDPDAVAVRTVSKDAAAADAAADKPLEFEGGMKRSESLSQIPSANTAGIKSKLTEQFSKKTRCIVYGLQTRAVQGMLDFDFMCKREKPSVAAMVFPFSGNHYTKFYWGTNETLVPVYTTIKEAVAKHPDVSVMVNFASFRSVYPTVKEALEHPQLTTLAIIAEGVPEQQTRELNMLADARGVGIIGPATVGGIKPGCFRIGNTGGMLDNIVMSKLYRPGSVGYVSKSGGMSNELNNIICRHADGVCEGVAIGGDRYPGSQFLDHILRYEDNADVKMIVLLGEVGGTDECVLLLPVLLYCHVLVLLLLLVLLRPPAFCCCCCHFHYFHCYYS